MSATSSDVSSHTSKQGSSTITDCEPDLSREL
jgi:hypothetical protein